MTIEYITKDITTVETGLVVHGVNCQYRMGSGVALAIKNKWPAIFVRYLECEAKLGNLDIISITDDLSVGNGYTQDSCGYDGERYASDVALASVLEKAVVFCLEHDVDLYIPRIGAGLGGLDWDNDVVPILDQLDSECNIHVCDL